MRIHIFGPSDGPTGYDAVTRGFLSQLYVRGHWVSLEKHTKWTGEVVEHDLKPIVDRCVKAQYPVPLEITLHICLPEQVQPRGDSININYTMFEADKIPPVWVESCKSVDLIIVPTEWNRDVCIDSGIPANKVAICPLGIDPFVYSDQTPALGDITTNTGKNVFEFNHRFLCVQELVSRKNIYGLLRAWSRAIRPTDNACLILKLGSHSGDKLAGFKQKFLSDFSDEEREVIKRTVLIYTRTLPEAIMPNLYAACTHYITMSCGEGWGLPETKIGSMRKFLIAPCHSGFTAYVSPETTYVIDHQVEPADQAGVTKRLYEGANWFKPIEKSAIEQIQLSIKDAEEENYEKPKALQSLVREQFNITAATDQLLSCFKEYCSRGRSATTVLGPRDTTDRSLVSTIPYRINAEFRNFAMHCKTVGTKCGIGEYAKTLFLELNEQHHDSCLLSNCTEYALLDVVDRNTLDLVHLQLEYQFITHQRLEHLLTQLRARKIRSVVTMHTIHAASGFFNSIIARQADMIVVNSNEQARWITHLANPKAFGTALVVVPMGCSGSVRGYQGGYGNGKDVFEIAFFGFSYFHKGIDKLILATHTLNHFVFGGKLRLCLYSVKPQQDTVNCFEKCQDLIQALGMQDQVTWNSEYLSENDLVQALSRHELIVLPYSGYGGKGVSAAGRTCLRAGVPMVVTRDSYFSDLIERESLVHVLDTAEELHYSLGNYIAPFLKEPEVHQELVQTFRKERDKFFRENSWEVCARKHLALYKELCNGK